MRKKNHGAKSAGGDNNADVNNNQEQAPHYSIDELRSIMAPMLEQESSPKRDGELLCGATLLAEQLVAERRYREVKECGELALEIIGLNAEGIRSLALDALPRLIDAVESTVYNHLQRDLLRALLLAAHDEGRDMDDYFDEAETFIKLTISLGPDPYQPRDERADELRRILAKMFSSEQLLRIIERPWPGHLRRDPVEFTWEWEDLYYNMCDELDRRLADVPRGMGFCFRYWSAQAEYLKKRHGIEWRSPSQMNPRVMFD